MSFINLNIVKEQYSRMTDHELLRLAINESENLTMDSFHLLRAEFAKRDLDLSIIEDVKMDKALSEITMQSNFAERNAADYAMSLMKYAFDEKANGKTNVQLYHGLLRKGLSEEDALMFVHGLSWKVERILDSLHSNRIIGWILSFVGAFVLILFAGQVIGQLYIIHGLLLLVTGLVLVGKNHNQKERMEKILKNLNEDES